MAHQWFATPVLGDEAKQAMLDFVPFAGSRWKMADTQSQVQFLSQFLQGHFPQTRAIAVAAASVCRDQEFLCPWKPLCPHALPPALNRSSCELRCVAMNSHADPALIVHQIINPVRNRFAQCGVLEVMNANFLRLALGPPFLPRILKISNQFLLFCVHRHYRLPAFLQAAHLLTDVFKLGITVGMVVPFAGLAIRLQTVTEIAKHIRDRARTYGMILPTQFQGQTPCALARPAKRRL